MQDKIARGMQLGKSHVPIALAMQNRGIGVQTRASYKDQNNFRAGLMFVSLLQSPVPRSAIGLPVRQNQNLHAMMEKQISCTTKL